MRKFVNEIKVRGRIFNFGSTERRMLQERVTGVNSKNPGVKYLRGEVNIAVDDKGENVVSVYYNYVPEYWPAKGDKPQRENRNYTLLKDLLNENETWEAVGKENAACVRINSEFEANQYFGQDDQLHVYNRIRGGFISRIARGAEFVPGATFNLGCVLVNSIMRDEESANPHLELHGYAFSFTNALQPFTVNVRSEGGIDFFTGQDISNANPMVTQIWGNVNNIVINRDVVRESAFGEPYVEKISSFVRSYDVTGVTNEELPWDDESTITKDEMRDLLKRRDEQLQADREYRQQNTAVVAPTTSPQNTNSNNNDKDDYDFWN